MKKLVTLLLAAGLVFSAVSTPSAAEIRTSGFMDITFSRYQNLASPFMDSGDVFDTWGIHESQQKQSALQRFRFGIDIIASENLSAHYQLQVGQFTWGGPNLGADEASGGALGSRASNIVTRFAYIDWMIPNTQVKVRMGQQPMALPAYTYGSPILDDSATGIVVSAPINDNIGVTGVWARALSDSRRGNFANLGTTRNDLGDAFALVFDLNYDGFAISPWAMYFAVGEDSGYTDGLAPINEWFSPVSGQYHQPYVTGWMAGFGGELTMFDPFRFTADFYYSATSTNKDWQQRKGWYMALGAEYKTPYGTPALKGWYATGEDNDLSDGSERPLTLSPGFGPTTTYYDGRYTIGNYFGKGDAAGTWGVSARWDGLSFIEGLSHDFALTYIRGTNSASLMRNNPFLGIDPVYYLSKDDSLIEVDFNTTYNIYRNLATVLELSYIFENLDEDNWGWQYTGTDQNASFSNVWRAALNFRYSF